MRFSGVIPARFESTRLPGKALLDIAGKPLIQHVYERCARASVLSDVWVATDDDRIEHVVCGFGGKVVRTRADHPSGTDRVAEAARSIESDVIINIQGDEPLISTDTIDAVCRPFLAEAPCQISTAAVEVLVDEELEDPDAVKVVFDQRGFALYFSRARIPFPRRNRGKVFKHLGIYGYQASVLQELMQLPVSPLEQTESLEQLRFLENGFSIAVRVVQEDSIGVDTPADLERVRALLENDAVGLATVPRTTERGR